MLCTFLLMPYVYVYDLCFMREQILTTFTMEIKHDVSPVLNRDTWWRCVRLSDIQGVVVLEIIPNVLVGYQTPAFRFLVAHVSHGCCWIMSVNRRCHIKFAYKRQKLEF